jgi:hypothetical protein
MNFPQDELKSKTELIQQLGATVKRASVAEGALADMSARVDQLEAYKLTADAKVNEILARAKQAARGGVEIAGDQLDPGLCGWFVFEGELLNGGPLYVRRDGGARLYVSRKFEQSWILDNPVHQIPRYVVIPMDPCDGCVPLGLTIACRSYETATFQPSTPPDALLSIILVDKIEERHAKPALAPEKKSMIASATAAASMPSLSPELTLSIGDSAAPYPPPVADVPSASSPSEARDVVVEAPEPVVPPTVEARDVVVMAPEPVVPPTAVTVSALSGPRVSVLPTKPRLGKLAPSVSVGALDNDAVAVTCSSLPMPIPIVASDPAHIASVFVVPAPPAARTAFSALASLGLDWQEDDDEDDERDAHPPSFLAP